MLFYSSLGSNSNFFSQIDILIFKLYCYLNHWIFPVYSNHGNIPTSEETLDRHKYGLDIKGWRPFLLQYVETDVAKLIHVWMEAVCDEFDDGCSVWVVGREFKWELVLQPLIDLWRTTNKRSEVTMCTQGCNHLLLPQKISGKNQFTLYHWALYEIWIL